MKFVILAIASILVSACATGGSTRPPDSGFLQVVESPEALDGKTVTVRAWITLRHEDKNLWATWKDHENWETTRCISLVNYDSLNEELDGQYVEVTGVLRKDASNGGTLLRLASCRNLAIEVSGPNAVHSLAH